MTKLRTLLAVPLAALAAATAPASEVRDRAGMFSRDAVQQAKAALDRAEAQSGVPTIIETVGSLGGRDIREVLAEHARGSGIRGLYVLVSKQDKKFRMKEFRPLLGEDRLEAISAAFVDGMKLGDPDAALRGATKQITQGLSGVRVRRDGRAPAAGAPAAPNARRGGGSGVGALLLIGAVIVGVLLLTRIFANRGAGYGAPGQPGGSMGRPGFGPGGYGPGYGAPGYGGRGGFWQGMLGGLGGAFAGNWLYDQFSGRHHHPNQDYGANYPGIDPANQAGGEWTGGEVGGDWGGGGGDAGGSWGVADSGGGGDWGGGGGDWGGGGGDWGGGDAGGDWT
jgi:uncharacterized protein